MTVRQFAEDHAEFEKHDIGIVRMFHSPIDALALYQESGDAQTFPILADPDKRVYTVYGVAGSLLSLFSLTGMRRYFQARRKGFGVNLKHMFRDGMTTYPADILIRADGTIAGVHYGKHFSDSLQPQEALRWATESLKTACGTS